MKSITRKAYAKINLGLDVLSRRPDGYHEVKMVMQTISLHDELIFEKVANENGTPQIILETNSTIIPADESNIVYRAADLIFKHHNLKNSVKITINKIIPVAAGLGGGSSDAASVFHGLNELFNLNMTIQEMCWMAVKIGADVPYCIIGGTVLAEGIGERLTPLKPIPSCFILIVKPDISVSTKWVYENLKANELKNHPDIDGMVAAINNEELSGILARMENVLETVTIMRYPLIQEIKSKLLALGAKKTLMSGSGPTVFGIFINEDNAKDAYGKLKEEYEVHLCTDPYA